MRDFFRRRECYAIGCAAGDEDPYSGCVRCGTPAGAEGWRFGWYWQVRFWLIELGLYLGSRCADCGRRLWPWRKRVGHRFCSAACLEANIPF
jgi:hypothetical protein